MVSAAGEKRKTETLFVAKEVAGGYSRAGEWTGRMAGLTINVRTVSAQRAIFTTPDIMWILNRYRLPRDESR